MMILGVNFGPAPQPARADVREHKIVDEPDGDKKAHQSERAKLEVEVLLVVAQEQKPICAVVAAKRLGDVKVQCVLSSLRALMRKGKLKRDMLSGVYHYSVKEPT